MSSVTFATNNDAGPTPFSASDVNVPELVGLNYASVIVAAFLDVDPGDPFAATCSDPAFQPIDQFTFTTGAISGGTSGASIMVGMWVAVGLTGNHACQFTFPDHAHEFVAEETSVSHSDGDLSMMGHQMIVGWDSSGAVPSSAYAVVPAGVPGSFAISTLSMWANTINAVITDETAVSPLGDIGGELRPGRRHDGFGDFWLQNAGYFNPTTVDVPHFTISSAYSGLWRGQVFTAVFRAVAGAQAMIDEIG